MNKYLEKVASRVSRVGKVAKIKTPRLHKTDLIETALDIKGRYDDISEIKERFKPRKRRKKK